METNVLYCGDNLEILRDHVQTASVDLVYLDPPFNSNRDYNVIFKDESGNRSDAQLLAFEDTWHWGPSAEGVYSYLTNTASHIGKVPSSVSQIIGALRSEIGTNQMMAYLVEMTVRLVELHRVLKPTGSLWLHCDPTASHYLKLVLDAIFGPDRFLNEVIWQRTGAHNDAHRFGRITDTLLYYSKTKDYTFNAQFEEYDPEYVKERYRYDDGDGRLYWANTMTAAGPGPERNFRGKSRKPPAGTHWRCLSRRPQQGHTTRWWRTETTRPFRSQRSPSCSLARSLTFPSFSCQRSRRRNRSWPSRRVRKRCSSRRYWAIATCRIA